MVLVFVLSGLGFLGFRLSRFYGLGFGVLGGQGSGLVGSRYNEH